MPTRLAFVTLAAPLVCVAALVAAEPPARVPSSAPPPDAAPIPPAVALADTLFARCEKILAYGDAVSFQHPGKADAATALGLLGDPRAVPLLAEHLRHADNASLRRQIVRALGWIGGPAAIAALEETLRDRDPGLRMHAAAALRTLTGREPSYDRTGLSRSDRLREALQDPDPASK